MAYKTKKIKVKIEKYNFYEGKEEIFKERISEKEYKELKKKESNHFKIKKL